MFLLLFLPVCVEQEIAKMLDQNELLLPMLQLALSVQQCKDVHWALEALEVCNPEISTNFDAADDPLHQTSRRDVIP